MPKKNVLIIDDDRDILFTISEICSFAGLEGETAPSGKEGFAKLKDRHYDLVIMDYHMPGWNGLTTLKKIRSVNKHVSVLVLTVDERQEIADEFIKTGATDFAIKPIKAPDLIARINVNLKISEIQYDLLKRQENMFVEKGISSATLDLIEKHLRSAEEEFTIDGLSKAVGLAYQTVHRYVQFLLEREHIEVIPVYGSLGRPKNKYRYLNREKS